MKIAVIGAGNVGKALGKGWARRGHDVTYGVRQPGDAKHAGLKTAPIAEAARVAEALALATAWMPGRSPMRGSWSLTRCCGSISRWSAARAATSPSRC
jgi:8-hydroxy-5-deazaflavin:NADPH oxidoreductase